MVCAWVCSFHRGGDGSASCVVSVEFVVSAAAATAWMSGIGVSTRPGLASPDCAEVSGAEDCAGCVGSSGCAAPDWACVPSVCAAPDWRAPPHPIGPHQPPMRRAQAPSRRARARRVQLVIVSRTSSGCPLNLTAPRGADQPRAAGVFTNGNTSYDKCHHMHTCAEDIENIPENTRHCRASMHPTATSHPGLVTLSRRRGAPGPRRTRPGPRDTQPRPRRGANEGQDAEYGETTTWARCRSLTSEYPIEAMVRLSAPMKFSEPSARVEGP